MCGIIFTMHTLNLSAVFFDGDTSLNKLQYMYFFFFFLIGLREYIFLDGLKAIESIFSIQLSEDPHEILIFLGFIAIVKCLIPGI